MSGKFWTDDELAILRKLAEEQKSPRDVYPYFRNRTVSSVEQQYKRIRRQLKYNPQIQQPVEEKAPEAMSFRRDDEILMLRKENDELKEEIYRYRKKEDWAFTIAQRIITHIKPLRPLPVPKFEKISSPRPQDVVSLFSDCQVGQEVEYNEMGGMEEYNIEVFKKRLDFWAKKVVSITDLHRKAYNIPTLHIFGLGDIIEGFDDKFAWRTADPDKQIVEAADAISIAFRYISGHFETIEITWMHGNHGRLDKNLQYTSANLDKILGYIIQARLADIPNLTFTIPNEFWTIVEVQGKKFFLFHGNEIKSWLGFPWYGQERMDARLAQVLKLVDKGYDYFVHGHWHSAIQLDAGAGERLCNGSFVGCTPYSLSMGKANRPTQLLFGVHPEHGITWSHRIRLDKIE